MVLISLSLFGCMTTKEREAAEIEECERLIETHLNSPMCANLDYYKSSGNGDLNTRGYAGPKAVSIGNCRKARKCIGFVESKYEKALWTNGQVTASPYIDQKADGKSEGNVVVKIAELLAAKKAKEDDSVIKGDQTNNDSNKEIRAGNIASEGAQATVNGILNVIGRQKDKLDTVFTVEAKQGIFTQTDSRIITFTLRNFLEAKGRIELHYRTYDCNEEFIINKEFETFTIGVNSDKGIIKLREFNAPFLCQPYFTVTTSQKTTTTVRPIEKYRGINKELKSYQEDKDTYYIYVDADKARIVQYHVDRKSTRKIHREQYTLNMDSCQYEIEKENKLIKNMGGRDILKSEDAGWGFEDDTNIYVDLPSSDKQLSVTWGSLKKNGSYSSSKKYKKEIPQFVKKMMGKVNDMATLFRKESKNNKEMEIFKSLMITLVPLNMYNVEGK